MRIELFQDTQAEAVSHLIRRNLREVNSRDYSETFINDLVAYFSPEMLLRKSREQHIFVAIDDEENVIGTAGLVNGGSMVAPNYYCVAVFVLPEWHRKGIGTRLMEVVEAFARTCDASRITVPAAVSAIGFYQKMGYSFKDGIDAPDERGEYRMVKEIV